MLDMSHGDLSTSLLSSVSPPCSPPSFVASSSLVAVTLGNATLQPTLSHNQTTQTSQLYEKWHRIALWLAYISVLWNAGECVSGLYFGSLNWQLVVVANAGQSGCEIVSAILVAWRLQENTQNQQVVRRERKGLWIMGTLFVALSIFILLACTYQFYHRSGVDDALPGLIVNACAAVMMITMYFAKKKAANIIDSSTLMQDANCSLYCFRLSTLCVLSSILCMQQQRITDACSHQLCQIWYVDPVVATIIALMIGRDGIRSLITARDPNFSGGCGCCAGASSKTVSTCSPSSSCCSSDGDCSKPSTASCCSSSSGGGGGGGGGKSCCSATADDSACTTHASAQTSCCNSNNNTCSSVSPCSADKMANSINVPSATYQLQDDDDELDIYEE